MEVDVGINSCTEVRMYLVGSETIVCLPYARVCGGSMAEKRGNLEQMSPDDFKRLVEDNDAAIVKVAVGNCALMIPSGFWLYLVPTRPSPYDGRCLETTRIVDE